MSQVDRSVLVLGNYRQTITVIRSLGRAGYRVILGIEKSRDYTQFSRYTSEVWRHPVVRDDSEDFFVALQDHLARNPHIQLIFPVGERQIVYFNRRRDRVPGGVHLIMADRNSIETCFDKAATYALATRLAVPVADYRQPRSYAECEAAVEEVGVPCVIKPNDSRAPFFGKKAIILQRQDELAQHLPAWPDTNGFLFVQKFITGLRHNCHFRADRGQLLAYFEQCVMRTNRLDHTASGVDGLSVAPRARHRQYVERLVRELGYSGPGCCQFLVNDDTGESFILEINPRLDATCAIPFYCGYEFPLLATQLAGHHAGLSSTLSLPPADYPVGRRGAWVIGDLEGLLDGLQDREIGFREAVRWLGRTLGTASRADFHLTWSRHDPMPALHMGVCLLRNAASVFRTRVRPQVLDQ